MWYGRCSSGAKSIEFDDEVSPVNEDTNTAISERRGHLYDKTNSTNDARYPGKEDTVYLANLVQGKGRKQGVAIHTLHQVILNKDSVRPQCRLSCALCQTLCLCLYSAAPRQAGDISKSLRKW